MELIKKVIGIKFSPEERKVIEDLADNCSDLCETYSDCPGCPFEDFCNNKQNPHEALTYILDELTKG